MNNNKSDSVGHRLFVSMCVRRGQKLVGHEIGKSQQMVSRMCSDLESDRDFYTCIHDHFGGLVKADQSKLALRVAAWCIEPLGVVPTKIPVCSSSGKELDKAHAVVMKETAERLLKWANAMEDNRLDRHEIPGVVEECNDALLAIADFRAILNCALLHTDGHAKDECY